MSSNLDLATNCCFCFSLATGVIIIATLDLLQGGLTVLLGAACLLAPESFRGHPLGDCIALVWRAVKLDLIAQPLQRIICCTMKQQSLPYWLCRESVPALHIFHGVLFVASGIHLLVFVAFLNLTWFCTQEFRQLASLEIPAVESWTSIFFLLASVIGCMENIWNLVAGKLSLAFRDKHSVAGVSAKPWFRFILDR